MSFWSRVGDAFEKVGDSIGSAWVAATDNRVAEAIGDANRITAPYLPAGFTPGSAMYALETIDTAFSQGIARPLSTASQVLGQQHERTSWDGPEPVFSAERWREAWNRSGTTDDAEGVSFGQAFASNLLADAPFDIGQQRGTAEERFAPEDAQARQDFFHDTWSGKLASGSIDLGLNLFADPGWAAGKGFKFAVETTTKIKPGQVEGALKAARGATGDLTKAEIRKGEILRAFNERTDGMTAGQMAALPEFRSTGDAGAFANLFAEANKIEDVAVRHDVKTSIRGAALGDVESIRHLRATQADLADELERLGRAPVPGPAVDSFSWDDAGQGMLDLFAQPDPSVLRRQDEIRLEMSRLDRVIAGRTNKISGTPIENAEASSRLAILNEDPLVESWLPQGLAGRPVRVVRGSARTRVPGFVNTKDATRGYDDMMAVIGQMKYSTAKTKRDLTDMWAKATTDGGRRNVAAAVEKAIIRDAAAKYGLSPKAAETLLKQVDRRRAVYIAGLKGRLYSAADDADFVHFVDPEEDIAHAFSVPLLKSQIEDAVPITDPRVVDKLLKSQTNRRMLDRWSTSLANGVEESSQILDEVAIMMTKAWKDLALMRGAYPLRVQMDTQGRMLAYLGAMQYFTGLKKTVGGQARYLLSDTKGERSLLNFFKEGDLNEAVRRQFLTGETIKVGDASYTLDPATDEEGIAKILRLIESEGGGPANIIDELADGDIRRYRETGDWGKLDPTDQNWFSSWQRAVQQIRGSATARQALVDGDVERLRDWVNSTPEGRAEWLEFIEQESSQEEWLAKVIQHVNHYLPTQSLRESSMDSAKKFFESPEGREFAMPVHGASYSPLERKAWAARHEKIRKHWYKIASDIPETIMGRVPLYVSSYKANMREAIEQLGEEGVDLVGLDAIRRTADAKARQEVSRILYDASHASNASHSLRFVMPFFTAWEDTMRKWGRLIAEDPSLGRRLTQIYDSPNDYGMVVDSEGNRVDAEGRTWDVQTGKRITDKNYRGEGEYFLLPKQLGFLTPGGSSGLRIRKDSFNAIFQGEPWWLPGWGPLVQVPANKIVLEAFPAEAEDPLMRWFVPTGTTTDSPGTQFLPAWIKQARNAFGGTEDYANVYALLAAQETVKYNLGERKDKPKPSELARKTRQWFILRAATDNLSPVKVTPTPKLQFYVDKAHEYRNKYGVSWQEKYYEDFPQYFEMSISLSANETGIQATEQAWDATQKWRAPISRNPKLGWFFVGADNLGTFNSGVYDWQSATEAGMGKKFRGKKDPNQALHDIEVERGWIQWNKFKTAVDLELERRGLNSLQSSGAEDLNTVTKAYRARLGAENSAWLSEWGQRGNQLQNLVTVAQTEWSKSSDLKNRPDMQALRSYLEARKAVKAVLKSRDSSLESDDQIRAVWEAYTASLVRSNVGFEQMWNRVLENDDLSQELING